jgi:DNA-binding MarR family transcriptional regulator
MGNSAFFLFPQFYWNMYACIPIIPILGAVTPEETIDFHIRWAWHGISRLYNNRGRGHELTTSVGYVLLTIDKEGTPSTQLGPRMGMEPRSLVRTLQGMEEDGLIFRRSDERDGRKVLICLTEKGKEKRRLARQAVLELNEGVMAVVGEQRMQDFFRTMNDINRYIEKRIKNEEENQ